MELNRFVCKNYRDLDDLLKFSWSSPSNIALVKYWGKNKDQTPKNSSISFTLSSCKTKTSIIFSKIEKKLDVVNFTISYDGKRQNDFRPKIEKYFASIIKYCPYLLYCNLEINTKNTFPHSSGIASSASGMSALSLCIMSLEKEITKEDFSGNFFFLKASFLSRIGSGSACRSVYGGFNIWGKHKDFEQSSDLFSLQLNQSISTEFENFQDTILLVDENQKDVSSSAGHSLMDNHPFSVDRYMIANKNTSALKIILEKGNLFAFCELVEKEAMMLHSLMMTSSPSYVLMKPETLKIIDEIKSFRNMNKVPVCFTLDAGANVHVLYPEKDSKSVLDFINSKLSKYCFQGKFIKDHLGKGPEKI
ncbi:MAG: diphosphomevalonate decarboxylase [Bacteroidetes bacterium MED-G13]|nr:MAG: diphosphomevalonate decarboxylase [Bacteroidetes bacterium MED-G13]